MIKKLRNNCLLLFLSVIQILFPCETFAQKHLMEEFFKNPPNEFRPVPLWFINGKLTEEEINHQLKDANDAGFGGVSPLPLTAGFSFGGANKFPGIEPEYFSADYFNYYEHILKQLKKQGQNLILYDDLNFPSGIAGGKMRELYPNMIRKILTRKDTLVSTPQLISLVVPKGKLMAVVAMEITTRQRLNLKTFIDKELLRWDVPDGDWKIMFFTVSTKPSEGTAGYMDVVDYLDPEAVRKFLSLSYDVFASHYKPFFQNTIKQFFFDDVGFFTGTPEGERTWTDRFNEKFEEMYGEDPDLYYPALWEDIGSKTAAARIALFNTRAELLSNGFPRIITEWCDQYSLKASGHAPDNYNIQPVNFSGDVFKFYKYQQIPTVDLIFSPDRGQDGFKLVSSAANIYDRPVVAAETFGAIAEKVDDKMLYRITMSLFVRGINQIIPHAMWYDYKQKSIRIPPLISPYNTEISSELPLYNEWVARCCSMLQGGKTIADIAILYPIESLEAWYELGHMDGFSFKDWAPVPPEIDYLSVGNLLTSYIHRDFTFVHPEIFEGKQIEIEGNSLKLNNKVNGQEYHVLVIPGGKVISVKTLEKIKDFYENGGCVIATTMIPSKSTEFGKDDQINELIRSLWGIFPSNTTNDNSAQIKTNANGGKIVFVAHPDESTMSSLLEKAWPNADVVFEGAGNNKNLSYIHKQKEGRDIYFIANRGDKPVDTFLKIKGKMNSELWNPYNGQIEELDEVTYLHENGTDYTRIKLKLEPVKSLFIVANPVSEVIQ